MCKANLKETHEFLEFLSLVEKRFLYHNQVLTENKKTILRILFDHSEHLSVKDIVLFSKSLKNKSLDTTTTYRILLNFETFGIVDSLSFDDNKRRYELSYLKKPHYHLYCQYCSDVIEFENIDIHDKFLSQLKNIHFKATSFNVIINGVCKKCHN